MGGWSDRWGKDLQAPPYFHANLMQIQVAVAIQLSAYHLLFQENIVFQLYTTAQKRTHPTVKKKQILTSMVQVSPK